MSLFTDLRERARALLFAARQEQELADELRFHIEREVEERVRRGADPQEARRAALLALGGVEGVKEEVRDVRGIRPLQDLVSDFRYALRSLRRDPIYTAAAVLVLGLGLGAATAVFIVADAVLLSPLPYREAHRLVRVGQRYQSQTVWQLSTVDALAVEEQQRSFDAFGLVSWRAAALSGAGAPERISVGLVTSGFFRALEVRPVAGRVISPADEAPGTPPVVVLSYTLARQQFGGAAAALDRSVAIDGMSHTVVGVLPPGMDQLGPGVRAAAWPVLRLDVPTRRGPFWLRGVGRLRDGVTLEAATRDLAGISERIFPLWASSFRDKTARIAPVPLRDSIVGGAARSVGLFAAAVVLVLLVAIVNVATLSLVRASARGQELAVRAALGAGRVRLARLPLTEGLTLGLAAGIVGLAVAGLGLESIARLASALPRVRELALDGRTAGFALLAALVSGLLVSVSPVLSAVRGSKELTRRADSRRTGTDHRTMALRSVLVVAQFALALPLLLGASLLLRSFLKLQEVDLGFDPEGLVSVSLALPAARYPEYPDMQQFWQRLEQRAAQLPGLASAGLISELPPHNVGSINNFDLIDRPVPPGGSEHLAPWLLVTPGYFDALGVPLLEGRMFTAADSGPAPPVVLVSRWWAERYYPGESAVGRQMVEGGCTTCPLTTVIGVVGDVKYSGIAAPPDAVYAPLAQSQARNASLVVRSRALPATILQAMREVVAGLDPELPVVEQTMTSRVDYALSAPGRSTAVLASFAATALMLAAVGIFGLMSYTVRQRRREIGVRIALGADPATITRMFVGRGLRFAAAGTTIGLGLTLLEARWLQAFLFGVGATDPVTIAAAAGMLFLVAGVACWLPGLRASRIHPVEAIAAE
jgi:predicted permease